MSSVELIFKDYYLKLCEFAYRWTKSQDIAKDIVQDAFMILIENEGMFDKPPLVLKSFLYTTVKNLSNNYLRRLQVSNKINQLIQPDEVDDIDMLNNLIQAEIVGELYKELEQLPGGCQHICKLIYFENKKYEEVADELKISINTVKTQRQRALRILKSKFLTFFSFLL
ncbi:hypothetical protein KO02_09045 [Sphingobacterium sp. ML3W]|uniref:RNA polymerase sigma-70 factor n=1 Tax=Sphingobacterium sp. ML3W TaxID=1538644 RepID=UPI0004F7EFE8|nr:RNA polymerase sigma-70 factor [Sphingobacterium sp. ML3W]AIM36831.1 hypothetical protein KO02_09045 [Sphingobacterium sp. ML3W]